MLKDQNFNNAATLRRAYVTFIFLVVAAFALAAVYPFLTASAQRSDAATQTNDSFAAGGGTGVIEICTAANGAGLDNNIFRFTVTGVAGVIEVPVGNCSSPIDVPIGFGGAVITELDSGRTLSGGNFSGGFLLAGVESFSFNSQSSMLGEVNRAARTAQVNIVEGGIAQQLRVQFVNQYAVKAYVEICNNAPGADSTVANALRYTIAGMPGSFIVPPAACTSPMQVHLPSTPGAPPVTGNIRVTQLSKQGFTLESASAFPAGRFNDLSLGSGINNTTVNCLNAPDPAATAGCVFTNSGGGYADVDVVEGGLAQTTPVNFNNRVQPGRLLKICKIAGAGVAVETPFTFDIYLNNETEIGASPVTVQAGDAANGGFCAFVSGQSAPFVNGVGSFPDGSTVTVVERASSGSVVSAISSPTGTISNVNLAQRKATIAINSAVNILEFTNMTSAPVSAPTSEGPNVTVAPTTNLNVTFDSVDMAGDTTVTVIQPGEVESLPSGFSLSGSTLIYEITTSAMFTGNIKVTFNVPNVADAATCRQLLILRYTGGAWNSTDNADPQYDPAARVCKVSQTVTSLSSFAGKRFAARVEPLVFAVAQQFAPSAAPVVVAGRAMTAKGRGIRGVVITMTDSNGVDRTAVTSSFGYYRFADVAAGETYIISARGKRFSFARSSRVLNANADVSDFDFIGEAR